MLVDMTTTSTVAIIGTGFGGLGMAIRLKQSGLDDLVVFEKGDDVGGCWRENTYPGAACDVPSHLYSFSFEPKHDWSRRFAPQPEILDYLRHCAEKYDVRRHVRFNTEVTGAEFDEGAGVWEIALADGSTHRAQVLVTATGQLSRPAYPRIPGIDSFAGELFHSARWNHDYDLTGKRVAVIGTGASAIQFVPAIVDQVRHLTLFQKDAPYVTAKPDREYHRRDHLANATIPGLQKVKRTATYWLLETRALGFTKFSRAMALDAWLAARNINRNVADPHLRGIVTPTDPIGCKRILLANDYYQALDRHDVDVIAEAITEIRPEGLVTADGALHEVDAIILGTGFAATDFLAPMQLRGRDGLDLNEAWRDGAEAYLGISVTGFPNLFMLYGPNTNLGHSSIVFMLESQVGYVLQAVQRLRRTGAAWLDVRADAQDEFNQEVQRRIKATVWDKGCTSWYQTADGKNTNNWPGFTFAYRRRVAKFDASVYDESLAYAEAAAS
jgi:cation diffusion facilitator CzcD-associated flavoprotein CzcO